MNAEIEKMIADAKAEAEKQGEGEPQATIQGEGEPKATEGKTVKRLGSIRLDAYMALPVERPETIVEGFLSRKTVAAIAGEPGSGKSLLLAQLAFDVATGRPFLGMKTEPGATLLIDLEMPRAYMAGERGRVTNQLQGMAAAWAEMYICNVFDGTVEDPGESLTPDVTDGKLNGTGMKGILLDSFAARLEAEVAAIDAESPGFRARLSTVIIDGAAEFCGGLIDENSAPEVRKFVMELRRVAAKFNVAILILLHTGKDTKGKEAKSLFRGSSAWRDAVDYMYVLTLHTDGGGSGTVTAKLEAVKVRYGVAGWVRWVRRDGPGCWDLTEAPPDAEDGGRAPGRPSGYDAEKFRTAFFPRPDAVLRRKDFLAHDVFKGVDESTFDRWRQSAMRDGVIERAGGGEYGLTAGERERMRQEIAEGELP